MEENKKFELDKKALENGIEAKISISFIETEDGKMEVLSASVIRGYDCMDYVLALDTPLFEIIKDLIR